MNGSLPIQVESLGQLAEMKRIFSGIETGLDHQTPACVVVTSAERGEGKTTTTAGLAAVAARQSGRRVLAVDLDWHFPRLHAFFGLEPVEGVKPGEGKTALGMVRPSGQDRLDVLPAIRLPFPGGENETEENALALEILRQARNAYDHVFLDTTSLFPTNRRMMDPVAIAKAADGVILVVLANVTPRQEVKRAKMMLETAGAKVVGVIVNQWKNPLA
jgi:Mrp family chromosome partitioning ATPase